MYYTTVFEIDLSGFKFENVRAGGQQKLKTGNQIVANRPLRIIHRTSFVRISDKHDYKSRAILQRVVNAIVLFQKFNL